MLKNKIKIGVFDSGLGGLSFARAIRQALPHVEVVFKNDAKHVPYGDRDIEQIHKFTLPILQELVDEGCRVIVIACNTVTTNLIERLRQEIRVPLVGTEPMVKPAAANTKTGVIAVCATPRTLSSMRYKSLKDNYAKGIRVLEPECNDWAKMIESNNINRDKIASTINRMCVEGADQIVLGCTHYHWIEELIKELADKRAEVIQPESAIIIQLKRVLERLS